MVTEHDRARPWLILGREHHTIELPEGELFFDWASREWPAPRFSVQLDPWALEPD